MNFGFDLVSIGQCRFLSRVYEIITDIGDRNPQWLLVVAASGGC